MKKVLEFPLKAFSNDWVLRSVIHSVWIMFGLFATAYLINFYNDELFIKYERLYTIIKGFFNTYISITVLGYFLSKYKFCVISLVSFYGIVLLRLLWYANQLFKIPYYDIITISLIGFLIATIIVYKIIE